ncbi:hypothetical protein CfE428DRAFT_5629 [Chthoniobacter flavus Ellin428]|uniref:Uncharacterized protein n=1 Tax=Chthoniobacter flavus Ellin428 TaxID=497964 RepID=B4D9N9_9BACT|nr:hypothetical protein [Chthoniobacter flavus]EDY16820.1 hypothetical protein CfE428DRAFT_5629 [Chthoniobacter flavus Ellin428]TCO93357.1 hypothetical protein EV701_10461 [Chthoniobacter flavus]
MPNRSDHTLRDAEDAIHSRLIAEHFQGQLHYDASEVMETDRWWYIPFRWVGCASIIVNKDDLYVNWLGSAIKLQDCIWGHDRGVYCDWVDFTFATDTDMNVVRRLIRRFQHMCPRANETKRLEPVWYRESEIASAVATQFPVFRRHFAWFAIPELRAASEEGLQFSCLLMSRAELGTDGS